MLINNAFIHVNKYRVKEPKATVIITHGVAEHSGRFAEFAEKLNTKGFDVITYDIRGHGQSSGKRGAICNYKIYLEDLHSLVLLEKNYSSNKIFLLGHSLGGIITNLYALNYDKVDGTIIVASPTNYIKGTQFLRLFSYKLIGGIKIKTNFSDPKLSHNAHNINDPLNLQYFKMSLVGEVMIRGMKHLIKGLPTYKVPTLILQGERDKLVPLDMTKGSFDINGSKDKELLTYEHSMHDLLHDVERDKVFKDIVKWLGKRT